MSEVQQRQGRIRVLCVDDNQLVGDALGLHLGVAAGVAWLGQLLSADELLARAEELRPDVVLLDVDMPGMNPFEAMRKLGAAHPEVRVVMLSGHIRRRLIEQAMDAGAWGYLSKDAGADEVVEAVRRVAAGEIVLCPQVEAVLDA